MAEDVAEATESLPKEAGLVGLDRPLDQLDLTKMLAESLEPEEQERSEETSPSGDAVEDYIGEIPSTEIIGVLETAMVCVISQAIKELQDEE